MHIYWVGTSLAEMDPASNFGDFFAESAGDISPYVTEGFRGSGNTPGGFLAAPFDEGASDFWLSGYIRASASSNTHNILVLLDGETEVFRIARVGSSSATLQYHNGSIWVSVGTGFSYTSLVRIDLHVSMAATGGVLDLYLNGFLHASYSGDTTLRAESVNTLRFYRLTDGTSANGASRYSNFIVMDESTLSKIVVGRRPSAQGFHEEWEGAVGNISEVGWNPDTVVSANAPGLRTSYTKTAITSPSSGYNVRAVVHSFRGKHNDILNPLLLSSLVRYGSTDYVSEPIAIDDVQRYRLLVMEEVPGTTEPWDLSDLATAETGFATSSA